MSEEICRLCLQTISNNNYQTIAESLLKTLKLNIKLSERNVICSACSKYLEVLSNIKTACVYGKDRILPLPDLENDVNLDSIRTETISNPKSLMKMETKCSFCARAGEREDFVSLNESMRYETLMDMLMQHIPEMNLNNTEELSTCEACLDMLQGVLNFILKCLEVEEKINKYSVLEGTDDKGQIELKDVQQFICKSTLKHEIEHVDVDKLEDGCCNEIKKEFPTTGETETSHSELNIETAAAEAEIKYEREVFGPELITKIEAVDIKFEQSDCDSCQRPFIENDNADDPLEISDMERHGKNIESTHKTASEIRRFKCEICPYEAKQKGHLTYHLLTHGSSPQINMLKCEMCSYKTYRKSNLNRHSLTHKSSSEINMFKCAVCSYETYRKENLKQHLLTHESPSEINTFKCEMCLYQTKHKRSLKNHLLIHKSPAEIKMFKCETCSFETKRKSSLKDHLLIHKSISEVNMFKCETCSFETKHKSALKGHLLVHESSSQVNMFKCATCPYETKRKGHLKSHLLTHRNRADVKTYKCKTCSYKSKNNESFIRHLLTHKNTSKCTMCEFATRHKGHLERHLLKHRSPADLNVFKSEKC